MYPTRNRENSLEKLERLSKKSFQNLIDFSEAFDFIHRGKMEQMLYAYGLLKVTVTTMTMFNKNTKPRVRLPDEDTDFFNSVAGILEGDILAPYLFIICLDSVHRTSINLIKNDFTWKEKSRKLTISRRNYDRCRRRRWSTASHK